MKHLLTRIRKDKKTKVFAASMAMTALSAFPALAESTNDTTSISGLLSTFTAIAAWLWSEIGLLLTFIMGQPILLLSMSIFFIGVIVAFFIRVFHSV